MPANSDTDVAMRKSLPVAASMWVEAAKKYAKTGRIKSSFSIGQVQNDGLGTFHIDITNDAPEAGAYEFGSGIHRTHGSPAKYPIVGKNRADKNLVFFWAKMGRMFVGHSVQHPGVAPVPFMKPALQEEKANMAKAIGQAFKTEVIYKSIREMFHSENAK
jgi:hypothetical protein